ncbi:MAG: Holliday junction resolvase RuvX [Gammaproteobacteria bacterium]|nr:Holliday junction resolvase RuvX [Gammaproteobacteria bacterium]NNL99489.1 Holliday junction resolvase RuvX [Gammaproteobacteria bacterium]
MSGADSPATLLAFDFGTRRIGVAVGQTISRTATPLALIPVRDGRIDWPAIAALVDEWRPAAIIVGLPVNMDGTRHALADRVERFARQLGGRYGREVKLIDERLSSVAAAEAASGAADTDAHAARVILESWLNDNDPH